MKMGTDIHISNNVLAQEVAGETVLLDLASESYFGLDAVGTRIWQLLQAGKAETEVVDTLLVAYAVEREVLEKDVTALLGKLENAGLIRRG